MLDAGADTEAVLEAEVMRDTLDDREVDDTVALRETEVVTVELRLVVPVIEAAAELTREREDVGDSVEDGMMSVSVGITREETPKKGAVSGLKRGPVSVCSVSIFFF